MGVGTHTHTLEKVTGTHTLVEGMDTSWVRVRVWLKLPTGYPCPTLIGTHLGIRIQSVQHHPGEEAALATYCEKGEIDILRATHNR